MAFDFPNTPAEGATYSPANGPQYIFQNGVWKQVLGGQSPVLTAVRNNLLVNGSFIISQEHGGAAIGTSGQFPADQWSLIFSAGYAGSAQRFLALGKYGVAIQNVIHAAAAGAEIFALLQTIEGLRLTPLNWGVADAIPAVLNFKTAASAAGTYCVSLREGAGTKSIVFDLPTTGALTEWTFPIPAQTSGNWSFGSTAPAGWLTLAHSVGPTYRTPTTGAWVDGNFLASTNMTNNLSIATNLQIFDAALYPDPQGTGRAPPYVDNLYTDDLNTCYRYYWKPGDVMNLVAYIADFSYRILNDRFPVVMRTTPSMTGTVSLGSPKGVAATAPFSYTASAQAVATGSGCSISDLVANARM